MRHNIHAMDAVYDGEEALGYLSASEYDGMILDVMMPRSLTYNGRKTLRAHSNNVSVMILTTKSGIDDQILGLNTGADDYLTKPFAMKKLLARIRAINRCNTNEITTNKFAKATLNNKIMI